MGLGGGGGGLDEEAVFEEGLEFEEERWAVRGEAVAEAVFDAAEGEVEVGEDEFIGFSADDGHEDDELAGAGDDVALVWEFEGGSEFSVGVAELEGEALTVPSMRRAEAWRAGSLLAKETRARVLESTTKTSST